MREIWFAVVGALMLSVPLPAAAQAPKPVTAATAQSAIALTDQDRILGKADAPITIVEYASLSCPHCAHFANDVLPKLQQKWIDTGKAKLIMRDFPLDEPALRAEMLARCAPADRFYPLVENFFSTQDKWVVAKDWRTALERIALLGGISKKEFDACLSNKGVEDRVTQSRLIASQVLGVDATPTFFINGKKYEGDPTYEAFDQQLTSLAPKS
jgi:protein-disulfide isomerase